MKKCPHCLKEITEVDERWLAAYENAKRFRQIYGELPVQSGWFGFATINKDIKRYESGERTDELLKELEGIE